jgi:hypothetical protein
MELEEPLDPKEAAAAIRGIVTNWRTCTQAAGLARKAGRGQDAVEPLATAVAAIIEAAAWLSQGDGEDRLTLARAVAESLVS